jgi:6-phosphogluconolactonase
MNKQQDPTGGNMDRKTKYIAIFVGVLMLTPLITTTFAGRGARNLRAGAVYVLTNQAENQVAAFRRDANGTLTLAGQFSTGGAGDPVAQPPDPPVDPLASQGALILSDNKQFLIAVNAGSNQISVLKINRNSLELANVVDSGGVRPISVALHDDLLYVLNEGGTPNITGFTLDESDGTLTPLANSTQPLIGGAAADPGQIAFTNDGAFIIVTEKAGNRLDTYSIDVDGIAGAPMDNPSAGTTPFGFAFNDNDTLVVSEAFALAPTQAAASSYNVSDAGNLSVISGSVHNGQSASCWVVILNNGKVAFVSNTASGTISSYGIGEDGSLTLINAVAADLGMNSAPRDMALNVNSRILFVQTDGGQSVTTFRIGRNGSLIPSGSVGGLPFGAQGIAAK